MGDPNPKIAEVRLIFTEKDDSAVRRRVIDRLLKLLPERPMNLPEDAQGHSIPEAVVTDIVSQALFETHPIVVLHHVRTAFNDFQADPTYANAVVLSGMVMRYATEHRESHVAVRR